MGGSSTSYHEPLEKLSDATQDKHRALTSLQEELEAVDWYRQRAEACTSPSLKAILLHNMEEEMEHAAMVLEWLRRHDAAMDKNLKEYLFTEGDIVATEHAVTGGDGGGSEAPADAGETKATTHRFTVGRLGRDR